jgi:phytoene synthase
MSDPSQHDIEDSVARGDPDRMAAAFFAPRECRASLMALYAFNLELARIKDIAHEPMAGHMRLAWQRDQVARIFDGQPLETPLGRGFSKAVRAHALPRDLVEGMIDARARDLEECAFADEAALEAYGLATSSALMKLAARVCGAGGDCDAVAGPAGLAFALVGVIRTLAQQAQSQRCFVPQSLLSKHNLTAEDFFRRDGACLAPAALDLAAQAQRAILDARRFDFPSRAAAAILPAVLARQYLPLIRRAGFDPFKSKLELPRLTAVAALARGAWTGRV